MDVQLKRGLLDICVLAAIKNKDSYRINFVSDFKKIGNRSNAYRQ